MVTISAMRGRGRQLCRQTPSRAGFGDSVAFSRQDRFTSKPSDTTFGRRPRLCPRGEEKVVANDDITSRNLHPFIAHYPGGG